jgi:aromatic-amino-acid transaminase
MFAEFLNTSELRQQWEDELAEMRVRIKAMRSAFVAKTSTTFVPASLK